MLSVLLRTIVVIRSRIFVITRAECNKINDQQEILSGRAINAADIT